MMENFILTCMLCIQAKLGDKHTLYYDEKAKCWVEEGVAPPTKEAVFSSPPINIAFISNAQT